MQRVFVLSKGKAPLMPCHPARARKLIKTGKTAVYRFHPFSIILPKKEARETKKLQLKLDRGSKVTGIALILFGQKKKQLIWGANLEHRGAAIKKDPLSRGGARRAWWFRNTRYRTPCFLSRTRKKRWLAPSLQSRVDNITSQMLPLHLKVVGRGSRQMCLPDKYGFPHTKTKAQKRVKGFKTGDFVKDVVPERKNKGTHFGMVGVCFNGSFCLRRPTSKGDGINTKHCTLAQKSLGYTFSFKKEKIELPPLLAKARGIRALGIL